MQYVVDNDPFLLEYLDTHVLELELNRWVAMSVCLPCVLAMGGNAYGGSLPCIPNLSAYSMLSCLSSVSELKILPTHDAQGMVIQDIHLLLSSESVPNPQITVISCAPLTCVTLSEHVPSNHCALMCSPKL